MRNILLLNDFSPEAAHALAYGKMLAAHLHVDLLVWDIDEPRKVTTEKVLVHAAAKNSGTARTASAPTLKSLAAPEASATCPWVKNLQLLDTVNKTVHEVVLEKKVQLIIKGVKTIFTQVDELTTRVLSTTFCPVMLIPKGAEFKPLKRMVYMADLRYCRQQISSYLKGMAKVFNSSYSIAHISAGLPEPEKQYAISMFEKFAGRSEGINIAFNHIKERSVKRAADVLINTMHNDLIAMAYRRFHFKSLTDPEVEVSGLNASPVPLLLFPS